jgi:alpha-methylacyl-CoA racemase
VLAALVQRERTGQGAHLDVSVADGVLAFMSLYVDEYLATGTVPGPGHNILTGRYACYDLYEAGDGRWLAVGAIEPHFFANLCRLLGCEQFIEHQMDDDRQDEIRSAFRAAFATRDRDAWVDELAPADCCVSPVLTVPELVDDPQVAARGTVVSAQHPRAGEFRQLGAVLAGQEDAAGSVSVPDWSVTQTDDLLAAAGYDAETVAHLRAEGVIA